MGSAMGRSLRLRVGLFNLLGYLSGLSGPILIDPRLHSHVMFGARVSRYGWLWLLLAPLVFFIPFLALTKVAQLSSAPLLSCSGLLLLGVPSAFAFPPERPHMGIVVWVFGYALVAVITTWIWFALDDFSYAANHEQPFVARLERAKATVTFWQQLAIYGSGGYLAFSIAWAYLTWFMVGEFVTDNAERQFLGQACIAQMLCFSLAVVVGPLQQAFINVLVATKRLTDVRE